MVTQRANQKSGCGSWSRYLETGKLEEVLLLGHFQQMVLDEGVHLGQNSAVSHGAGEVPERDGVLGIHFRQQVVATDLGKGGGGMFESNNLQESLSHGVGRVRLESKNTPVSLVPS